MAFFGINAKASSFDESMDVKIGVFDAANVRLKYAKNDNKYDIQADVKTANFFGSIYPFLGMYEANGEILKKGVKPFVYKTKTKSRSHERTKTILYDEKGKAYEEKYSKTVFERLGKESSDEVQVK